jgi:hypothetical protein
MTRERVELRIGELAIDGVHADGLRVHDAAARELDLLASEGAPRRAAGSRVAADVDGGELPPEALRGDEALGVGVARAVWRALEL